MSVKEGDRVVAGVPTDDKADKAEQAASEPATDRSGKGPAAAPVVLVDGSAYLYRAFHVMARQNRPLSAPDGMPTGAIYVVVNMLRKLIANYKPDIMVAVFDAKGKTFRDDLYPDYKATRDAMPDDMRVQIEPLHDLIRATGMPLLAIEGVEADDVIGTLCIEASKADFDTIVSTGDKDMAQLVDEHVTLVNTMTDTVLDVDGVVEKFGVTPGQIVDYLALVGDTADNIPGVPSCGPKTAAKWLATHGDLETIMANASDVKGKIGEKLRDSLEHLPLSQTLTRIMTDVPLPAPLVDLRLGEPDRESLAGLYDRLGFQGWRRELDRGLAPLEAARGDKAANDKVSNDKAGKPDDDSMADAGNGDTVDRDYETILSMDALDRWIAQLEAAELAAFDTETTSLDYMQAKIVGVSFAIAPGKAAYVPLAHVNEKVPEQLDRDIVLDRLRPWLEGTQRNLVGQHLKYDINVLANHGVTLRNIAHDTMLESYVTDSVGSRHNMDALAALHLGVKTVKYEDIAGRGKKQVTFDKVDVETAASYAAEDADITLRLHHVLWPRLAEHEQLVTLYRELELPLASVLARVERQGVRIDAKMLAAQGKKLGETIEQTRAAAVADAGRDFNLGSPKQIGEIFFEEKMYPVISKTKTGQPSTAENVLEQLAHDHELPKLILQHRSLTRLKSTYIDSLPERIDPDTGRVHTSYHQAVASTGRLSSTEPNLQNIPVRTEEGRRIREAFVAEKGYRLLAADYSQIELRIMAHLSGDPGLVSAFEQGLDVHRATAAEVFGVDLADVDNDQRRVAKTTNFGLIYGMSAFGLARQLGIPRGEAQGFIDTYFARYPGVADYMEATRVSARECGFVETVFGRRLYLPDINARNASIRQYAERTAINAPLQGTAADIIKRAMLVVDGWLQEQAVDARIIMQVHDELVLEVRAGELDAVGAEVQRIMTGAATLRVPLEVDTGVGDSWEEAH